MKKNYLVMSMLALLGLAIYSTPIAAMPSPEEVPPAAAKAAQETTLSNKDIELAQMAIMAGLQTYQAHEYNNELTTTDKTIKKNLEEEFPALLNELNIDTDEQNEKIFVRFEELSKKTADLLLSNQNLYKNVNKEAAMSIVGMLAISSSIQSGKLDPLVQEFLEGMMMEILMGNM